MFPAVRPGPDHAHMAPAILGYLKENDFEKKPDRFGRRNAEFYKNHIKQEMTPEYQPKLVKKFNQLGFTFWDPLVYFTKMLVLIIIADRPTQSQKFI